MKGFAEDFGHHRRWVGVTGLTASTPHTTCRQQEEEDTVTPRWRHRPSLTCAHPCDAPDPRWAIAANTEIWTSDSATLADLARECDGIQEDEQIHGAVIAARHPTGWFVHALRSHWMPGDESHHFVHFVTVRVYLLLVGGPQPLGWEAARDGREWLAFCLGRDVEALGAIPDELPASW